MLKTTQSTKCPGTADLYASCAGFVPLQERPRCTHPKQEAEEEEKISDPGINEGERLSSVQIRFSVHF